MIKIVGRSVFQNRIGAIGNNSSRKLQNEGNILFNRNNLFINDFGDHSYYFGSFFGGISKKLMKGFSEGKKNSDDKFDDNPSKTYLEVGDQREPIIKEFQNYVKLKALLKNHASFTIEGVTQISGENSSLIDTGNSVNFYRKDLIISPGIFIKSELFLIASKIISENLLQMAKLSDLKISESEPNPDLKIKNQELTTAIKWAEIAAALEDGLDRLFLKKNYFDNGCDDVFITVEMICRLVEDVQNNAMKEINQFQLNRIK